MQRLYMVNHALIGGDRLRMILGAGMEPDASGRQGPNPAQRIVEQIRAEPSTLCLRYEAEMRQLDVGFARAFELAQPDALVFAAENIEVRRGRRKEHVQALR